MMLYDMSIRSRRSRRGQGPHKPAAERKDYLIQARVPRGLDDVLKKEAKRRRLSVSHLIRNVLEDTYKLVDGVISEVDNLVQDSVELSGRVRRDVRDIARSARPRAERPEPTAKPPEHEPEPLVHEQDELEDAAARVEFEARTADVYAWNNVVLHRAARCELCSLALDRGKIAHLGLSQDSTAAPRWLCTECLAGLESD